MKVTLKKVTSPHRLSRMIPSVHTCVFCENTIHNQAAVVRKKLLLLGRVPLFPTKYFVQYRHRTE